jgi:hypothetical protein
MIVHDRSRIVDDRSLVEIEISIDRKEEPFLREWLRNSARSSAEGQGFESRCCQTASEEEEEGEEEEEEEEETRWTYTYVLAYVFVRAYSVCTYVCVCVCMQKG